MPTIKYESISQYIESFPPDTQKRLKKIQAIIKKKAPGATSRISYNIPGFFINGSYLIYFAGYKKHVSIYPVPTGPQYDQLYGDYKTSGKGTIQFPNDEALPVALIEEIVAVLLKQNAGKKTATHKTEETSSSKKSAFKKSVKKAATKKSVPKAQEGK